MPIVEKRGRCQMCGETIFLKSMPDFVPNAILFCFTGGLWMFPWALATMKAKYICIRCRQPA